MSFTVVKEIDRYITEHSDEFAALQEANTRELSKRYGSLGRTMVESFAKIDARREIGERVTMLSFNEFVQTEKALAAAQLSTSQVSENDHNQPIEQEPAKPEGKDELSTPEHQTPELPHEDITP
jgi:hypothetical protein